MIIPLTPIRLELKTPRKSSKCTQNKGFSFHLWSSPYNLCTCPYNEGSWPYIDAIGTPKLFPSGYTWLSLTKFKLLHFPPKQQLTIKFENLNLHNSKTSIKWSFEPYNLSNDMMWLWKTMRTYKMTYLTYELPIPFTMQDFHYFVL